MADQTYEGMLLIEPTLAAKEWDKVMGEVQRIAEKAGAKIVNSNKWGERKLAYPIRGHKRGTYLLAYFNAGNDGITKIRRDCELSDVVLRALFLRHEGEIKMSVAPQELPPREDSWGGPRRERRY
jgi:small subunit ribosomal protein S6